MVESLPVAVCVAESGGIGLQRGKGVGQEGGNGPGQRAAQNGGAQKFPPGVKGEFRFHGIRDSASESRLELRFGVSSRFSIDIRACTS